MCTGNQDLWSLRSVLHFYNVQFNAVCRFKHFSFDLLIFCEHGICFTQIDTDIFANITLHNTCYNVFLFFKILIVYYFSFFLADLLKNQVFRIHCCNTSKLFGLYRNLTNISDLQCRINLFRIFQCDLDCRIKHFLNYFFFCVNSIITGLSVHDHLDVIRCPEVVFAGTDERVFNRIHHGISADVLLFFKNCQSFH